MVFIVIAIGAELPVAQTFVEFDGTGIVFAHFQPHHDAVRLDGDFFRLANQSLAHALTPLRGEYGNGVNPRKAGSGAHQYQAVAHQAFGIFGHNQSVPRHIQETPEAPARQPVFGKAAVFQINQRIQVLSAGQADIRLAHCDNS